MPLEIERRFLPKDKDWQPQGTPLAITQGYFKLGENATARASLFPWPHFVLNGERLFWLSLPAYTALKPALLADGTLPAGWKVRIRCYDNSRYVLDIKGPRIGTTRFELAEKPLSPTTGARLQHLCGDTLLSKTRYVMAHSGHEWHVDVYEGQHTGLVTCEVELPDADTPVDLPPWVGEEITDRKLFGN